MKQITDKLYSWASLVNDNAMQQATLISEMPFIYPHVALMPDAHLGKGATVGSVIPTDGAIIPAAVGVDIGCGMIAVRTQFKKEDFSENLDTLRLDIESRIPLSAGSYNKDLTGTAKARIKVLAGQSRKDYTQFAANWHLQLGSLGSGNHFIEVTYDENGSVWLFLHSGSRGIGNKIAMYHIKRAQELCKKWFISLKDPDLAYLVEGTEEFNDYIADLHWAQKFAMLNRDEMMDRLIEAVSKYMGTDVEELERINCHHNFTEKERLYGKYVYLSRKGAIKATVGLPGLIPGSMGTASYVVEGKGNPLAFSSSPHGAGRAYSRNEARKTFNLAQLREAMEGIEYKHTEAFLDEIPAAYKDIDVVMKDSEDLVEIKYTLRQIVNVKGA